MGSESGVFVLYKNGPVGIKLQSKRGLSESNFRGERDLSESDFRAKGTCRNNAFHGGGGGGGADKKWNVPMEQNEMERNEMKICSLRNENL